MKSLSKYLVENALTVSNRNANNRAKLMYSNVLSKYFTGSPLFPMTSEHIVLFILCCYKKQVSLQTVTTYSSALAHFNKFKGYPDLTQDLNLKQTLQGFQKLNARPDTRLPITPVILQRIAKSLPQCTHFFFFIKEHFLKHCFY